MRELVSARNIVQELGARLDFEMEGMRRVSNAWENSTCTQHFSNSKGPLMIACTKHIVSNYHWFRSMIKTGEIYIYMVKTTDQRADFFTKGLTRYLIKKVRYKVNPNPNHHMIL